MIEQRQSLLNWQRWLTAGALVLILLLGAIFRLTGINWDEDQHLHPDERFLTMVESAIAFPGTLVTGAPPGCAKWGGYFDSACSPLNPYNHDFGLFVYGTFPMFLTRFIGDVMSMTNYGEIHLVGRTLSALFDLSTVLLIFFIGRRMYGARAGLLGALFLAASVLDIQQSHFFTVDTFTNVPILIAFWFALDIADGADWRAFIGAGIAFGFALAGRINIAPFAAVLIAAAALRTYWLAQSSRQLPDDSPETLAPEPAIVERNVGPLSMSLKWKKSAQAFDLSVPQIISRAFGGLVVIGLLTLIVFRIAQPYAANGPGFISPHIPSLDLSRGGAVGFLLDVALSWAGGVNPKFADNMAYISALVAGTQDYPPGHQWTDRPAYIFPFQNMVLWGLGLPLGLAAWAGFLLAVYRMFRYREWQHLLIVLWVGITFAYTGQQWVKTMRYFLQIYPFLALLAGYFLVRVWDWAKTTHRLAPSLRRPAQISIGVLALVTIGYTLFWAGAFTSIYTRPVSRVTASRWIFQNIPPGAILANEHWDDPLPLRIDGRDPFSGMYKSLASSPGDGQMHWYDEDTPEKRAQAIKWLDEAQFIILSSNRLYGSITRLPMRYPMTVKYYEWLFDGTLGFDKATEITSRPQLFGIEINDDNAEEAFTVYDHPQVMIFVKSPGYSHDKTAALLNSVDLEEVYRFWPREATQSPTALLLTPAERTAQQAGGTWSEIFNPNDFVNQIPVIVWLIVVTLLGWLTFPITFVVLRALPDRGYIFAKTLGILLTAWGVFILASYHLLPFGRLSITLVILLIAIISAVIAFFRARDIWQFLRTQRTAILIEEFLFLVFFALFLFVRYGNPDLWHPWFGGEKPMDFAYLNAIIKSTWLPPYDPWFAGGYINYYYYGQYITATLIKFTGIVPEVAYNLALPLYFALLAMGAYSIAFNLIAPTNHRKYWAGLFAALFVSVIGNLGQVVLILESIVRLGMGEAKGSPIALLNGLIAGITRIANGSSPFEIPIGWWYWNASRIIPDTINEFPLFTFLYADLHAHLIALPFTLLAIGVALNFVLRARADDAHLPLWPYWQISLLDVVEVIVAALVLGGLRAINYADYPTYLLLLGGALAVGEYARRRTIDLPGVFNAGWRFAAIFVLSSVLYQPFISHFATAYLATEMWQGARTTFTQYSVVHGIFLFSIATFLFLRFIDTPNRRAAFIKWLPLILLALALVEITFVVLKFEAFTIAFPLLVLAGLLFLRADLEPEQRFVALLIGAGLALTMMVELIVYKGDIGRMNTVFKFYLQAWVFFAIAAAVGITFLHQTTQAVDKPTPAFRLPSLWWLIFGVLVLGGMLYPVTAARAKMNDRFVAGSPSGLNGMDYMRTAVYEDRDRPIVLESDRQAFEWMRANIIGSPVVVEGNAPLYHWASRVSIYTGLPTIIGWDWHQKQQRSIIDGAIIDRRIQNVNLIYNSRTPADALTQLKRFDALYIYVGDVERAFYEAPGLEKFNAMVNAGQLKIAYRNDHVTLYEIVK